MEHSSLNKQELFYGFGNTLFGLCGIVYVGENIYSLIFPSDEKEGMDHFKKHFAYANLTPGSESGTIIRGIVERKENYQVKTSGTDFQQKVWKALQEIPFGSTTTYSRIAAKIGHPKAVRAVGTAIGANPIAFIIPCHRVLRNDGEPGGFRWGLSCKKKILEWEKQRVISES